MPYTTVVAGTSITASWANASVRDQVVTPFATTAARDSAITSPVEGMVCYITGTDRFYVYDGTNWIYLTGGPQPLYAARMYRTSATTIGVGTVRVPFDTASYDYNSNLTTGASAAYTVPVTGLYDVRSAVTYQASNNPQISFLALYLTAGTVELSRGNSATIRGATSGDVWSFSLADTVALTAADVIYIAFANGGGNSVTINVGSPTCYFAVRKV